MKAKPIKLLEETKDYLHDLGGKQRFLKQSIKRTNHKRKKMDTNIFLRYYKILSVKRYHK